MADLAFIVSTGRTATKFLADALSNAHPEIIGLHEPTFSRHLRICSNAFLEGRISFQTASHILKRSRTGRYNKLKSYNLIIESNNFLFGLCDVIQHVYPQSKIIHVIRDPRDYIKSHINHGVFKGAKLLTKIFVPYWFMNHDVIGKNATDMEILAYRWLKVNNVITEQNSNNPNYILLRYEDIFSTNLTGIKKLTEFLNLNSSNLTSAFSHTGSSSMNKGKMDIIDNWRHWSLHDQKLVDSICGDQMRKYGYGMEKNWCKAP